MTDVEKLVTCVVEAWDKETGPALRAAIRAEGYGTFAEEVRDQVDIARIMFRDRVRKNLGEVLAPPPVSSVNDEDDGA